MLDGRFKYTILIHCVAYVYVHKQDSIECYTSQLTNVISLLVKPFRFDN